MATQPGPIPDQERTRRYKTLRETGLSMQEIADRFNVSKQAVAWRLRGSPRQKSKPWAERQEPSFAELTMRQADAVTGSQKLLDAMAPPNPIPGSIQTPA
jgi:transcriptional regulator with XRE-family HTH domain